MIIALDYATNMGVSWTHDEKTIYVSSVSGNQFEHLRFIKKNNWKEKGDKASS